MIVLLLLKCIHFIHYTNIHDKQFFILFIFLRIIRKIDRYNPDEIKQKGSLILGEATYLHYSWFGHNALSTKAM